MVLAARASQDLRLSCGIGGTASNNSEGICCSTDISKSLDDWSNFSDIAHSMLRGMTRRSTTHGLKPLGLVLRRLLGGLAAERDFDAERLTEGGRQEKIEAPKASVTGGGREVLRGRVAGGDGDAYR